MGGDSGIILKMSTIFCNDVCNNCLLLVTFGLCSPILAAAIVCSVLLKMSLWVLLVGRFTRCMLHREDGSGGHSSDSSPNSNGNTGTDADSPSQPSGTPSNNEGAADDNRSTVVLFAITALANEYIPLFEVLATSFWLLVWCSAMFVALLSWDIAMDEVGWLQSLWAPLFPLGYCVALRCAAHLFFHTSDSCARGSTQDLAEKAATSHDGGASVSLSPLHIDKL